MNRIGKTDHYISILILAAGSSSRMGQPKQLLLVDEQPLLRKSVLTALSSNASHISIVLGSQAEKIISTIKDLPIEIIDCPEWEKGMGNSLKKGAAEMLTKHPTTTAILVMVCDQPKVTSNYLNNLMDAFKKSDKLIVASRYSNTAGVPAIFKQELFNTLLTLDDGQGAKKILEQFKDELLTVDFPGGEFDLDTPEDYKAFTSY